MGIFLDSPQEGKLPNQLFPPGIDLFISIEGSRRLAQRITLVDGRYVAGKK